MATPAAFAIILDGRKVLLVQLPFYSRYRNKWTFAGGLSEPGETMLETAVREVKEETGLEFDSSGSFWKGDEQNSTRPVEIFTGTGTGELQVQRSELQAARWFGLDDALSLDLAYQCLDRLLEIKTLIDTGKLAGYN